jgi:PPK2 family polyphosphate:nucleotide phosphotransferase
MPEPPHTERYRIRPGQHVDLRDWDPNDTSGFDGDESAAAGGLTNLRTRLDSLQEMLFIEDRRSLLIVLQGMDTAGKDGTICKVFEGVNPSGVRVAHFRQPGPEELAHDFLWRVHEQAPAKGELVIFNRSHYESVLVEHVHRAISDKECKRRYKLIDEFERLLSEGGTTILKFYLNIDKDEQKKRLEERWADKTKRWKLTEADLAERKLWPQYMKAYERVLEKTSTEWAPWYLVPSNHKWYRDLVVAQVIVKTLDSFRMKYPPGPAGIKSLKVE